jgi:hypothetical protein
MTEPITTSAKPVHRIAAVLVFGLFVIHSLTSCVAAIKESPVMSEKTYRLETDQVLNVSNEIQIKHLGYGHRMTKDGDRAFFEFEVKGPPEFGRSQNSRIWHEKGEAVKSMDFSAIRLVFIKCEDSGPPHKNNAGVEFKVEPIKAVSEGAKFELKSGESFFVGGELGISLL